MNDRQSRVFQSYLKLISELARRVASLTPEVIVVFERLKATVAEIDKHHNAQYLAAIKFHVTTARHQLERMRKDQMLPLSKLARQIFVGEPGMMEALRVPHKRAPTEELLTAAARMVKVLRPHRALLAASGIDPARITRLLSETRQLKKIFQQACASVADRAVPTRRLTELFASAHAYVLVLDTLVPALFARESGFDWKYIRRVGKRIGRPRASRRAKRDDRRAAT